MNLPEFIADLGDEAAADLFGVEPRTAASWRRGERVPRPKMAREILRKCDGRLTFDDIYRPVSAAAGE